jgi:hypothetical protein
MSYPIKSDGVSVLQAVYWRRCSTYVPQFVLNAAYSKLVTDATQQEVFQPGLDMVLKRLFILGGPLLSNDPLLLTSKITARISLSVPADSPAPRIIWSHDLRLYRGTTLVSDVVMEAGILLCLVPAGHTFELHMGFEYPVWALHPFTYTSKDIAHVSMIHPQLLTTKVDEDSKMQDDGDMSYIWMAMEDKNGCTSVRDKLMRHDDDTIRKTASGYLPLIKPLVDMPMANVVPIRYIHTLTEYQSVYCSALWLPEQIPRVKQWFKLLQQAWYPCFHHDGGKKK